MNSSLDKFNPTLCASFTCANIFYVFMLLMAVVNDRCEWTLAVYGLFMWLFIFVFAIALAYPILMVVTPVYFRASRSLSFLIFALTGLLAGTGLYYSVRQIPKLAIDVQGNQATMFVYSGAVGSCSAIAAWLKIRRLDMNNRNERN